MAPDDDFGWDDDPLVRALRAPGTPEELGGEAEIRAAFRAARQPRGRVLRLVGRVGIGTTAAVATVALSAGVAAAAYTQVLPEPVQRVAHTFFSAAGVPPPKHHEPRTQATAPVTTPTSTTSATHLPKPTRTHGARPGKGPTGRPSSPVGTPTAGVPTTPISTPTSTPTTGTTKPPVRAPAAVTISVSSTKTGYGTSVSLAGTVTSSDGQQLKNRVVTLQSRVPGQDTWSKAATTRTDASGLATFQSAPLTQTTRLRLATTRGVHSGVVTVVVQPTLTTSVSASNGSTTLTVSSLGGQAGDTVTAFRRQNGKMVKVGSEHLGTDGTVSFTFPTPKRQARIFLVLGATRQHGVAKATATVGG